MVIIDIIILLLAIPTGYIIAYLCKDELAKGRYWFLVLILLSFIIGSWFYLSDNYVIMNSCFFITIISLVSYLKSRDKRWTK